MTRGELFDTCILIDHLNGEKGAADEIARSGQPAISQITWIEVMVGTTAETEGGTREFLKQFAVLSLDGEISEIAVAIRQGPPGGFARKPKLPDAIIAATARFHQRVLVTRNTKDFPAGSAGVRVPIYAANH